MLNRVTVATIFALLFGLFAVSTASAVPNRPPSPPPTDYWQDQGFILMAHQGGEWDFPPNTLFSYKSAMNLGADMIDMDAYVTQDGHIVLTHDLDARKNSNLTDATFGGNHDINDLTLPQLKTLDFAYKWTPHGGSGTPYRGIATWDEPAPPGFTANDFKIPTFGEVLDAFPDTPINIELKDVPGVDIDDTTAKMAAILAAHPGHDENVIINSFGQAMLDSMHAARPEHKSFSGSLNGSLSYVQGDPITPTPVAIEPPDLFQLAPAPNPPTRTVPVLKPFADYDGYKIFVWGSDKDPTQDTPAFYKTLIDEGADSYNTPDPIALAAYLCTAGIARPDGSPRCAQQQCPGGQVGIAPDECKYPPCPDGTEGVAPDCRPIPCPEGTEGTPPDCVVPVFATVGKVEFRSKQGKIRAGGKRKVTIKVSARNDGELHQVKVRLKSSSRRVWTPKAVEVTVRPGKTVRKTFRVKAYRKARGKIRLTAWKGHDAGGMTLKVKP